jgi:hypothetical protein
MERHITGQVHAGMEHHHRWRRYGDRHQEPADHATIGLDAFVG